MKWDKLGDEPCSFARALSVLGDRWTLMILRDSFLGVRRFEEFQARLGISKAILTARLRSLTAEGVLFRIAYHSRPARQEYRLTAKGLDLYPVMLAMVDWGNTYMSGDEVPPVAHRHRKCGRDFKPVMTCSECGEPLEPREISVLPGAGFPDPRAQRFREEGE